MKTSAATSPPAPRFVRKKTLHAIYDIKDTLGGVLCGFNSVWLISAHKDNFMEVFGLVSALLFLSLGAAQLWNLLRRRSPDENASDADLVEVSPKNEAIRKRAYFVAATGAYLLALLILVPRVMAERQTGDTWWQAGIAFNAYAVLVTNYAGWGAYRGWRALLDYSRETHSNVAPVTNAQAAPAAPVAQMTSHAVAAHSVYPAAAPPSVVAQNNGATLP